ncbi:MAG: hypothetical protein B6U76_00700 [Desulfurococcales archaeon ex4484_217_2]|nr:MAG: hypothetical protein B6U76_00700 [Desulfurococcales archaeon ex4484_217_2]
MQLNRNKIFTIAVNLGMILLLSAILPIKSLLLAFAVRILYITYTIILGVCVLKLSSKRIFFALLTFLILVTTFLVAISTGYGIYHNFDNAFLAHRVDGLYLIESGELNADEFLMLEPHVKGYPFPYICFIVLMLITGEKAIVHFAYHFAIMTIVLLLFEILSKYTNSSKLVFASLLSTIALMLVHSILLVDKHYGLISFLLLLYSLKTLSKHDATGRVTSILLILLGLGTILGSSLHNLILILYLLSLLVMNKMIKSQGKMQFISVLILLVMSLASIIYYSIELYSDYYRAYEGIVQPIVKIMMNIITGTRVETELGHATIHSYASLIRISNKLDATVFPWYLFLIRLYTVLTSLTLGLSLLLLTLITIKHSICVRSRNVQHYQAVLEQWFFLIIALIGAVGQIGHYVGVSTFVDVGLTLAVNGIALYLFQYVLNYTHIKNECNISLAIAVIIGVFSLFFLGFSTRVMSYAEAHILPLYVTPYRSAYDIFVFVKLFLNKYMVVLLVREPIPTYHNNLLYILNLLSIKARAWMPIWDLDPTIIMHVNKVVDGTLCNILVENNTIVCLAL